MSRKKRTWAQGAVVDCHFAAFRRRNCGSVIDNDVGEAAVVEHLRTLNAGHDRHLEGRDSEDIRSGQRQIHVSGRGMATGRPTHVGPVCAEDSVGVAGEAKEGVAQVREENAICAWQLRLGKAG